MEDENERAAKARKGGPCYFPSMPASRHARLEPPAFIAPQLTLAVEKPPEGNAWCHEIKYDGYRIHARIVGNKGSS
jgi:ATP-dependent DNA ligase